MNALIVSKLDAAKRQMETAVRLYFQDCEPVSIHTLTVAAYNLLRDINKRLGNNADMSKDIILNAVVPERRKEIQRLLNRPENFFKHADRDSEETIRFHPELTEIYLFECERKYRSLTSEIVPLFMLFEVWLFLTKQDLFLKTTQCESIRQQALTTIETGDKASFLTEVLPLLTNVIPACTGKQG